MRQSSSTSGRHYEMQTKPKKHHVSLTKQQVTIRTCVYTIIKKQEKRQLTTYFDIMTAAITPSSAKKHTPTMTAMVMRARDCTFSAGSCWLNAAVDTHSPPAQIWGLAAICRKSPSAEHLVSPSKQALQLPDWQLPTHSQGEESNLNS